MSRGEDIAIWILLAALVLHQFTNTVIRFPDIKDRLEAVEARLLGVDE